MRNYKSILCLLLSLVLIFSVVFPMGAAAVEEPGAGSSGSKGIKLTYVCNDAEDPIHEAMVYVSEDATMVQVADLESGMPEGYQLAQKEGLALKPGATELLVWVVKTPAPAPANKNVPIKFMTDGTTVVGTREVTVVEGETLTLNAAALAALVPEGYELLNKDQSVNVTYNTAEVRVLVSKIEVPAPANKNVPIKFMTDGTTVVGTREVTVAEGETLTLNAAALAVLVPEGYELQNKDQSVNVTYNTAEVRVLVSKIEVPAPANKNVPIKFMTDGTTVVGTREVTVAEGEEVVLNGAALAVLAPEGYELVNKDQSVKVTYNTAEVRVLVSEIEVPAPANKNVPIKFMTDGTTVVGTREVTVAEGETLTLNAAALAVLVPEGYELQNKDQSVNVTYNTAEVRVLVSKIEVPAPANKNVPIKFMTDGTTVVGTREVTVAEGEEVVLNGAALAVLAPEGYELVNKDQSVKVTYNTAEVRVLVSEIEVPAPANKNVPIKFMTDGTTVVGTREVTVAEGEEVVLNGAALAVLAPEGYELVNKDQSVKVNFNTKEVRVLVSKIEVPAPANKNVPIKFMTDGTTVVGTREVTVAEGETLTLNAAALAVLAPEGYELVNKDQSVKVTYNTAEVRVLVSKIEVPAPANKNVPIKFMTDGTTVVGTREVTVAEGEEVVLNGAALAVLAPEGYELVNKDQSVKVNFNTKEVRVLVSQVVVPTEPTVPEETKPEETKPEETKPEETKPEETKPVETKPEESKPVETKPAATEGKTPNTGDASHAMTWVLLLTVSAVCAACAFFYLKKGNANR